MIPQGGNIRLKFIDDLGELAWIKDKKYIKWVHDVTGLDVHHIAGSLGRKKTTDYLVIPVTNEQHQAIDKLRNQLFLEHLPIAFNMLNSYLAYLRGTSLNITLDPLDVESWKLLIKEVRKCY